jgi:hypothetical protein
MTLKIEPDHLETMRAAIAPMDTEARRERYRTGTFLHAEHCRDAGKRHRWDLFHDAGLTSFACSTLYRYVDDTHIDSALRQLIPPL